MTYSQSIAAQIERRLNADPGFRQTHRKARVYTVRMNGIGGTELLDYVDKVLTSGVVDEVVVAFNIAAGRQNGVEVGLYSGQLSQKLSGISKALQAEGGGMIAVPYLPSSAFPNGSMYLRIPKPQGPSGDKLIPFLPAIQQEYDTMIARIKASNVPYIDMGRVFVRDETSPSRRRLWGAWDEHLTLYGNELFGNTIANFMIATKPWDRQK